MDMVAEEWRAVAGHEGYEVSSLGRVRSLDRVVKCGYGKNRTAYGRVLNVTFNGRGYPTVGLDNGITKNVHRIVAEAFLGPSPFRHVVNHKDGNKKNNQSGNLEWITQSENIRHADRIGLRKMPKGENNWCAKLTNQEVLEIRILRADGMSWKKLANKFGVSIATIRSLISGLSWRHV